MAPDASLSRVNIGWMLNMDSPLKLASENFFRTAIIA
jgi:hypothetical protein